ncbi:MAG: 30S ribosomal protein S13 [Acidobacteria bacterium]|nr:30S ribosomal protein S13 [Acidobacteriota bacterium]
MGAPPILSLEQRKAALVKAAAARQERAIVKENIKRGEISLLEVLQSQSPAILKMRVKSMLEAIPGVGVVRAVAIMERIGISENRRVKGLGTQQLAAIKSEFGIN